MEAYFYDYKRVHLTKFKGNIAENRMKEIKHADTRWTLQNPRVRAEYDCLNREEFAILDEMLVARRAAGLSQAQVAEHMGKKLLR